MFSQLSNDRELKSRSYFDFFNDEYSSSIKTIVSKSKSKSPMPFDGLSCNFKPLNITTNTIDFDQIENNYTSSKPQTSMLDEINFCPEYRDEKDIFKVNNKNLEKPRNINLTKKKINLFLCHHPQNNSNPLMPKTAVKASIKKDVKLINFPSFCSSSSNSQANIEKSENLHLEKNITNENILKIILHIFKGKYLVKSQIENISIDDRLLILTVFAKKAFLKTNTVKNVNLICQDIEKFIKIINDEITCSNEKISNLSGIIETVLNRVLRQYFSEWSSQEIFQNGVTSYEINQLFWKSIYQKYSKSTANPFNLQFNKFEDLFKFISKKIQMNKKLNNKIFYTGPYTTPKYLNIFINKEMKSVILELIKHDLNFKKHFKNYQKELKFEFNNDLDSGNKSFLTNIQSKLEFALFKTKMWVDKNRNNKTLNIKKLKKDLKNLFIPNLLSDYETIFREINSNLEM